MRDEPESVCIVATAVAVVVAAVTAASVAATTRFAFIRIEWSWRQTYRCVTQTPCEWYKNEQMDTNNINTHTHTSSILLSLRYIYLLLCCVNRLNELCARGKITAVNTIQYNTRAQLAQTTGRFGVCIFKFIPQSNRCCGVSTLLAIHSPSYTHSNGSKH